VSTAPLPDHSRVVLATAMNWILPGAGLFLLRRRLAGAVIATLFLACFFAVVVVFVGGYANYFSKAMSDDLLKGRTLEEIGEGFHRGRLLAFAGAGAVVYAVGAILFSRAKRQFTP
jgi:hypothetical protein